MDCQKHCFDLEPGIHYINGAYMSPLLKASAAAGVAGIQRKLRPYQTTPQDFFTEKEQLRQLFAHLVNAPSAQHVALVPSASYGLSMVAQNLQLRPGQTIVVAEAQFPSNVYPWRRLAHEQGAELVTVPAPTSTTDRGRQWNEALLAAIDDRTALVALGHIHWANGTLFDLKAIGDQVHRYGGLLVIDGTQSVGALPIDVQAMGIDALICAGYKWLMGPYGYGYAYLSSAFWEGRPLEENWINRADSQHFAGLTQYRDDYQPGALRYDAGESSNFIHVPMCIAALEQLIAWGPGQIQAYCQALTAPWVAGWQALGYWIEDPAYRAAHLFGLQLPEGKDPLALQAALAERKVMVSVRGSFVRISPNVYNDAADMAALDAVLKVV